MTHDQTQPPDRRPSDDETRAEAPLANAVIDVLRSEAGPTPPPELEERTVRALRESGVLTNIAMRPALSVNERPAAFTARRAMPRVKAALAAGLVFAVGYLLGGQRAGHAFASGANRTTRDTAVGVVGAARIRAAGAAYVRALAAADSTGPARMAASDAAMETFHAAGVMLARLAPEDTYGRTVRLALGDAIRMSPQPDAVDPGASQWY